MKITTQQIKQIISEELDNLLYEEETDSKLKQTLMKLVDDDFIKEYDKTVTKQIFTIINNKLPDIENPKLKTYLGSDMAKQNPKAALEILRSLYYDFTPEEEKTIEMLEEYPLESTTEEKIEKVANYIVETKNLSGADLAFQDFGEVDLRGFNLSKVFAQHASFYKADLRGADLTGADLKEAWLLGALYDDKTKWPAGLDFVNSGAFGPKANLRTHLRSIRDYLTMKKYLKGANLREIDLSYVGMRRVDLSGANLSGAKLKGTDLWQAKLNNANLRGADLTQAKLWGADLTGVDLSGTILTNARYSDQTKWPEGFDFVAAGAKK
jgi:uncharacterized protein YjbI with pentapeptide repeats